MLLARAERIFRWSHDDCRRRRHAAAIFAMIRYAIRFHAMPFTMLCDTPFRARCRWLILFRCAAAATPLDMPLCCRHTPCHASPLDAATLHA